jgi:hypothetical protein
MCFYLGKYKRRPKTMKEDVVVFKWVYREVYPNSKKYATPYQLIPIHEGQTMESKLGVHGGERLGIKYVKEGLHSYLTKEKALEEKPYFFKMEMFFILLQVIIPKGAKYYEGVDISKDEIASNRLVYPIKFKDNK